MGSTTDQIAYAVKSVKEITDRYEGSINFQNDLELVSQDIEAEYISQPSKFAYWSVLAAQAKDLYDQKKLAVDKQDDYVKRGLISELDTKVRRDLESSGEKITEAKVSAKIFTEEKYIFEKNVLFELQSQLISLQHDYLVLVAAKDALVQKKDMLISLGAQLRKENN